MIIDDDELERNITELSKVASFCHAKSFKIPLGQLAQSCKKSIQKIHRELFYNINMVSSFLKDEADKLTPAHIKVLEYMRQTNWETSEVLEQLIKTNDSIYKTETHTLDYIRTSGCLIEVGMATLLKQNALIAVFDRKYDANTLPDLKNDIWMCTQHEYAWRNNTPWRDEFYLERHKNMIDDIFDPNVEKITKFHIIDDV